jgi:hypothetical protein
MRPLENASFGQCKPIDDAYLKECFPWTMHLLDNALKDVSLGNALE